MEFNLHCFIPISIVACSSHSVDAARRCYQEGILPKVWRLGLWCGDVGDFQSGPDAIRHTGSGEILRQSLRRLAQRRPPDAPTGWSAVLNVSVINRTEVNGLTAAGVRPCYGYPRWNTWFGLVSLIPNYVRTKYFTFSTHNKFLRQL